MVTFLGHAGGVTGCTHVQCRLSLLANDVFILSCVSPLFFSSLPPPTPCTHYLAGFPPTDRQLPTAWETRQGAGAAPCQGAVSALLPGTLSVPPSAIKDPGRWTPSLQGLGDCYTGPGLQGIWETRRGAEAQRRQAMS